MDKQQWQQATVDERLASIDGSTKEKVIAYFLRELEQGTSAPIGRTKMAILQSTGLSLHAIVKLLESAQKTFAASEKEQELAAANKTFIDYTPAQLRRIVFKHEDLDGAILLVNTKNYLEKFGELTLTMAQNQLTKGKFVLFAQSLKEPAIEDASEKLNAICQFVNQQGAVQLSVVTLPSTKDIT
jgi:hypothetical protein